ncbi:MAG: hypothetical protein ABSH07_04030 [Candidatus Dormibacteria bacterium]
MTPRRSRPPRTAAIPTLVGALLFSALSVAHFLSWGPPEAVAAASGAAGGFMVGAGAITVWWTWWERRHSR